MTRTELVDEVARLGAAVLKALDALDESQSAVREVDLGVVGELTEERDRLKDDRDQAVANYESARAAKHKAWADRDKAEAEAKQLKADRERDAEEIRRLKDELAALRPAPESPEEAKALTRLRALAGSSSLYTFDGFEAADLVALIDAKAPPAAPRPAPGPIREEFTDGDGGTVAVRAAVATFHVEKEVNGRPEKLVFRLSDAPRLINVIQSVSDLAKARGDRRGA